MAFHCVRCKSEIEKAYRACPHCGEPVTDFLRRYADEPVDGKYRILERLGTGGMGEVYKVEHIYLGTIRVIKVIRPQISSSTDAHDRFLREARIATKIQHPSVATMHDFAALPDGSHYMVWEFIDGENIAQRLKRRGTLGPREAVRIAIDALRGLDAIHRAGIVHRDISPENIMLVRESGAVKVIDLGVAKSNEPSEDATRAGVFVGKLRYASPEHLGFLEEGERIDGRADLYSLAMVLYEMLTGRPPFEATSPHEYILMHSRDTQIRELDLAPSTPGGPELQAVLRQAFQRDRTRRYATAGDFAAALEQVERQLPDPRAMATLADAGFDGDATIRVLPGAVVDRSTINGQVAEPTLRTPLPGTPTLRTPLPQARGEYDTVMRQPLPPSAEGEYETMMGAAPRDLKTVATAVPPATAARTLPTAVPERAAPAAYHPVTPPPPPPVNHTPRVSAAPTVVAKRRGSRWLIVAIVFALAIAAGVAAMFLSRSQPDDAAPAPAVASETAAVTGTQPQTSMDVVSETAPAVTASVAPPPPAPETAAAAETPSRNNSDQRNLSAPPVEREEPTAADSENEEREIAPAQEPQERSLGSLAAHVYTEGADDNEAAMEALQRALAGVTAVSVRGPRAPMLIAALRDEVPSVTISDDAPVTIHFSATLDRLGVGRKRRGADATVMKNGRAVFRYVMEPEVYRVGDTPAEAFAKVLSDGFNP